MTVFLGLILVVFGVAAIYGTSIVWRSSIWRVSKVAISILLVLVAAPLCIDNGLGLVTQGEDSAQTVIVESENTQKPSRLFVFFHGYNGNGRSLAELLSPRLKQHGTVMAFEPSPEGYDNDQVLHSALDEIDDRKPDEIIIYGESFGGMVLADLLRLQPDLTLRGAVLNASPSKPSQILLNNTLLRAITLLHGGPISTQLLQTVQQNQVGHLPKPGSPKETTVDKANRASLSVTAPTVLDELRYMAWFKPVLPGEFANRVEEVHFIHAPGAEDAFINNEGASASWEKAFGSECHKDIEMPWNQGDHTPTPAHPHDVAKQLLAVAGIV